MKVLKEESPYTFSLPRIESASASSHPQTLLVLRLSWFLNPDQPQPRAILRLSWSSTVPSLEPSSMSQRKVALIWLLVCSCESCSLLLLTMSSIFSSLYYGRHGGSLQVKHLFVAISGIVMELTMIGKLLLLPHLVTTERTLLRFSIPFSLLNILWGGSTMCIFFSGLAAPLDFSAVEASRTSP